MLTRRRFLAALGYSAGLGLAPATALAEEARYKARVVIVGGGYGGATTAKYLRLADPHVEVFLIEKDPEYVSCALSNEVLADERTLESLTFSYGALSAFYGVKMVQDEATEIDPVNRKVKIAGGVALAYDRLVVSPGIAFRWGEIEGYDEAASRIMPHAWFAGEQTRLLRSQLDDVPADGKVFIVAPPNPYKCPPGPYERAGLIAHFLWQHNKRQAKVIILDAKEDFAKKSLFLRAWEEHYPGMVEWVPGSKDGRVLAVDPQRRTLKTEFDEHRGDVVNVIPPQKAGRIAEVAGLTDESGWCPVDPRTFESRLQDDIHVIGDACIAGAMPKSAYAANSQGKNCALAIQALINENPPPEPSFVNTCYSIPAPGYGISVAAVYRLRDGEIVAVEGAGGVSPLEGSDWEWEREMEAAYARSWFVNITSDIFL